MTKPKQKLALIGAVTLIVPLFLLWLRGPTVPDHAGRPVSAWFEDLCSGVYGGTPKASRFAAAYAAFPEMDPKAVPYLIEQLRFDRSGVRQKLIGHLHQYAVTRPFTANLVWPSARRGYAAVALRQMGAKAEAAIPALLEVWAHDAANVNVNAVLALESILRGQHTDGAWQPEWQKLESDVIAEAANRYPEVAEKLGISHERAH